MAKLTTPRLRVIIDDPALPEDEGNEYTFQPRNVELVAWDRDRSAHRWPGAEDAPFLWMTYLAWKYLQRTGQIEQCTLADFEQRCLSVETISTEDVDPTQRGSRGHLIVALALLTGMAPAVWAAEDDEAIATALDLLDQSEGGNDSMAGPTINIKILADASQAAKTMDGASGRMSKFAGKMKSAALPIAAAGAALVGMGKSAVEDAAGQAALAKALQNTTGATNDQVSAVEDWISKTAQATGVADDDLRPALATLARATGSVGTAQAAMGTAMDVAAATGKPLAAVTAALAKGYGGNAGALGKLVPGLDKGVLATKDMSKITKELARLTGGSAAAAAQTSAGQFKRMTLALDETQESIGGALLPALNTMAPMLQSIAAFMQRNADVVGPLVIGLGALAAVIWVVNVAMAANPFVLWIVALAALIAAVVIAYKKVAWFRTAVQTYIRAVITVWKALATAVMVAVRAIATAAMWLWSHALRPALAAIIAYVRVMANAWRTAIGWVIAAFSKWWQAALFAKDKILDAWRTTWNAAKTLKDKIVTAFNTLASAIAAPFDAVGDAVSAALGWLDRLYTKLTSFTPPKWLSSIIGKVGGAIGFAAPAATRSPVLRLAAPAGRAGRAGRAGSGRVGGAATAAESGTAATLSTLLGGNAQVVVQVSDRKMANLIDVQIRDNATAMTRALTRRQVVIV